MMYTVANSPTSRVGCLMCSDGQAPEDIEETNRIEKEKAEKIVEQPKPPKRRSNKAKLPKQKRH